MTTLPPAWLQEYDERYRSLITASRAYAEYYSDAGFPGHYLMLCVATMAAHIDELSAHLVATPTPTNGHAPTPRHRPPPLRPRARPLGPLRLLWPNHPNPLATLSAKGVLHTAASPLYLTIIRRFTASFAAGPLSRPLWSAGAERGSP